MFLACKSRHLIGLPLSRRLFLANACIHAYLLACLPARSEPPEFACARGRLWEIGSLELPHLFMLGDSYARAFGLKNGPQAS